MAAHSSILAWRIPWTEEPGGRQPIGSQRESDNDGSNLARLQAPGLRCGAWDLMPPPGIKPRPPALGTESEPLDDQGSPSSSPFIFSA